MENHWTQSMEWDKSDESTETSESPKSDISPGSYHCKSALRDHTSNMKLFLYRTSFYKMAGHVGNLPYTEEALLLLPDLWNCFYHGTHGLNRIVDTAAAKAHSTGSVAFTRWAGYTLDPMMTDPLIQDLLQGEQKIWGLPAGFTASFMKDIYAPTMVELRRCLHLQYFLCLTLVILNYKPTETRPDIHVMVPGISRRLEEGVYVVKFNEFFWATIHNAAVHIHTPIFDQIMQKDIFLNLCDKISERINVIIGARAVSEICRIRYENDHDHPDLLLFDTMNSIIKWGDALLYSLKNRAYDLLGTYEAFCVSAILKHDNPLIWDNGEFQANLLEDIIANSPHLYRHALTLTEILNKLSPTTLSEIHGLWRIWGHPIIDLEGGMRKMESTCLKNTNVDEKETAIGARTFKHIFTSNYYAKHHHYPLCNITDYEQCMLYQDYLSERDRLLYEREKDKFSDSSYIHRCIRSNSSIDDKDSRYVHKDWDQVVLIQSFQIPQSVNLATMIKDKAISQTRSELVTSIMTRNSVFDPKNRRGVIKWLSEQTLRLKNFLTGIDEDGLPENDCIIGLYPKERELKTKARFFSLMSYKMRMYITATEEILGKYLLPYFPMITMSDTLLSMIIRLYNMTTKIGANGSTVTYSMNIDFSKWNQNMRERTNHSIFTSIDQIIGFRHLISRTHAIFRASYLYLCSGEYIPQLIRGALTAVSPYSRIGDESGKEGLRQKGWTITTVCDIVSLAFTHGVRIELIGGGDNQVLTVTIQTVGKQSTLSPEQQMHKTKEKMRRFRNALAKKMEKRGLPLKLEETWISHRLLMYNKIMYLDGVPLPGRLKVISRMFSNSNEGIACLGSIMSTLGTGYQSLSAKDYDPILSWLLSRWITHINISQFYMCSPMSGAVRLDRAMSSAYKRGRAGKNLFGPDEESESIDTTKRHKHMIKFDAQKILSCNDLLLICLYYHKVLGGPSIGTPLAYIMKGFPDPLSEALTFNYQMIHDVPIGRKGICDKIRKLTVVKKASVYHWEHLLEDPVSINHDAPAHGIAALRNQASTVMKSTDIKNLAFKELISIGDNDYLRDLSAALCESDSVEPRLLHDIVGSTIPGYVNTILSKVDQSSTLNKLATNADVVGQVYTSEMLYYMYLAQKIANGTGHTIGKCPTADARGLRNMTWGREIIGVTTPHPSSYLIRRDHTDISTDCDHNYISVLIKRNHPIHHIRRGPFRPYFGSYTAEKFKSSVLASAYGDEDLLKRSLKIQKLLGWRYREGSNMYKLIQGILSCVTDADPGKFLPTVEEITGDVEHRYHDMATKHGGIPSCLVRDLTYASCNTSTFINHSKGAANETIHFQAAIIYTSVLASISCASSPQVSEVIHYHESCGSCITKIDHVKDDGEDLSDIKLASCPENPLMFIEEKDIPVHYHNVIAFHHAQLKQTREKDRAGTPIEMKNFEGCESRSSWLLLAITSMMLGKMKKSAVTLLLNKMVRWEVMIALKTMLWYSLITRGRPTSLYNLCDIRDMIIQFEDTIGRILSLPIVLDTLSEMGANIQDSPDSREIIIKTLADATPEYQDSPFQGAFCKYQDPEYGISRTIIVMYKYPTIKTCAVCVKYWVGWARNHTTEHCSTHMREPPAIKYHLYSLDKLSHHAGPACDPEGNNSNKRKRINIFKSMKLVRTNTNNRLSRIRLSQFLHTKVEVETMMKDLLCCDWKKQSVGTVDTSEAAGLEGNKECTLLDEDAEPLSIPSIVQRVSNIVQPLVAIIRMIPSKSSDIHIGLEVPQGPEVHYLYNKALSMMQDIQIDNRGRSVCTIHLLLSEVLNLEDVNYYSLKTLEYALRQRSSKMSNLSIKVVFDGESSLDISSAYSKFDAIVLTTASGVSFSSNIGDAPCPTYLMTDVSSCHSVASKVNVLMKEFRLQLRPKIHLPSRVTHWPYAAVLEMMPSTSSEYISHEKTISYLVNTVPVLDVEVGNTIVTSVSIDHPGSIIYDLYREHVNENSGGITSEAMYESIRHKLTVGLMMFALQADRSKPLSWKCSLLLKMIFCLDIMTSENRHEMMSQYSRVVGTSFSSTSYKQVILYTTEEERTSVKRVVNWTAGTIGEDIPRILSVMEEWIICDWRTIRVFKRKVLI